VSVIRLRAFAMSSLRDKISLTKERRMLTDAMTGTLDVKEFLSLLRTRPKGERWELIEGVAVMMNPPTLAHQRIAMNLSSLLNAALAAKKSDLAAYQEIGVRSPGVDNFMPRPDVVVFPGVADYAYFTSNFELICEILSPTNTRREIGIKMKLYKEAATCQILLVIDSRKIAVELHARETGWTAQLFSKAEAILDLPSLGLRCPIGELYRRTPLDPYI
jgi:Uma2 family endonuclease